jgi:hypothetical protein
LHLAAFRTNRYDVYSSEGLLLKASSGGRQFYESRVPDRGLSARLANGDIYRVQEGKFGSRVERLGSAGIADTVVSPSFYLWLLGAPSPAWYFVIIGILSHRALVYLAPRI